MLISDKVLKVLAGESISFEELETMLNDVAFTSIRGCNRRYFQWLFLVKHDDSVLEDMQRVDVVEIGHGENRMLEDHDPCNGEGCRACGWVGKISRAVDDSTAAAINS